MAVTTGRIVVEDGAALARSAAVWLAETVAHAIAARGRCALALAGGSTPAPVYAELAAPELARRIDWSRVDVYFGDERAVPPRHPDSNYRLASGVLLSRVPIPAAQIHRMEGERQDLEAAAADYERLLPPALDVLLLGLGSDGHTASLFPRSPALEERMRRVIVVESPKPPPLRLTITPPVIAAARYVAVLATGKEKAGPAARALEGPATPQEIPARLARHGVWFLDRAAAALLARSVA